MNSKTDTQDATVSDKRGELAWHLFQELRKEIMEGQKLRAQLIGVKVAFVGTLIAAIAANLKVASPALLVVPALAAAFFDFLVAGYSFSVKRLGHYAYTHLEPIMRESNEWPANVPLWEEFMRKQQTPIMLGVGANFMLTVLVIVLAIIGVLYDHPYHAPLLPIGKVVLLALLTVVVWLSRPAFAASKTFVPTDSDSGPT